MRVMVFVKATETSEKGIMPTPELLAEMGRFNEELVKAGVMLTGEGLHPSKRGKRIVVDGTKRDVIDGPFGAANDLVAGFWIWKVASIDEAIAWAKKCPEPMPGERSELEIRPIFEAEDFA